MKGCYPPPSMRVRLGVSGLWLLGALSCKSASERRPPPAPATAPVTLPLAPSSRPARPISSEVVAFEKGLQRSKLRVPGQRAHQPRLAFARGLFAQLGDDALSIFDADDPRRLLAREPVHGPRALLSLPDGALLAVDARRLLRWEPGWKHAKELPRPVLLPDSELYADAQRGDRFWVFDPARGSAPGSLRCFLIPKQDEFLPSPVQTIELAPTKAAVLGVTREGVWLYLTEGLAQRFAPGGARLPALSLDPGALPNWVLPAQRLDQSLWLSEKGELLRVQLGPRFVRLSSAKLSGTAFAADVGDEGRLIAVVVVTGEGPRFELELFDPELRRTARVLLPAEAPTGNDDWIRVVTGNQQLAVDPAASRVAVGGSTRASIFDAAGKLIFSIPSM